MASLRRGTSVQYTIFTAICSDLMKKIHIVLGEKH